jgi:rubrerythrin
MQLYRTLPELKKERHLALWHKALRARWSPEDVDVTQPAPALGDATRDALARILSPVLMGEQAGLYSITGMVQIMGRHADVESQLLLTTMAVDEAKHTELFARYYGRLEREPLPIRRFPSGYLFQAQVMSQEPAEWLTGSLVSECLAKLTLEELRRVDFDPVFNDICARILEDEARHLGFNHVFLEERLGGDDESREAERNHLRERLETVLAYVPPMLSALASDIRHLGIDADDFHARLRDETSRRLERSIGPSPTAPARVVAREPHARDSA